MNADMAAMIWLGLGVYLGLGLLIGLGVAAFGLTRLTPGAAHMPWRVRLLILPGLTALWPVVLLRLAGVRPKEDRP